jgi:hypothetical protein
MLTTVCSFVAGACENQGETGIGATNNYICFANRSIACSATALVITPHRAVASNRPLRRAE